MGNQLTGIAPSQILSVDHYFSDLPDYEFDRSLGSTRFFKVARARHKEGLCVVKVFAIQDPSLPLKTYQDELTNIKVRLGNAANVLPFQKSILTDKASLLIRQYIKDNLYDRISTRPFLNLVEKKWIAFQLLSALEQCHSAMVCHGDIKTENIMITAWNWALLSDIASFKPAYLPEDNPADFNFYFDTSRRRTCYVAPERFLDARQAESLATSGVPFSMGEVQGGPSLPDMDLVQHRKGDLAPSMDVFSVGCVIAELFTDGNKLFDLSELLAYKKDDYYPTAGLSKIEDNRIREMVEHMILKDPQQRLTAVEYMRVYKGQVFPEQFYDFLKGYMTRFAILPVLTSDEKISRIKRDINQILQELLPPGDPGDLKPGQDRDGCLVIVVSLLTSCIRTCKYCVSKLTALELMLTIARHVSDDVILERLLPYMLFLVNDPLPQVRAQGLKTLTQCLHLVRNIPRSDANIFPEYILPSLSWLTQDAEVIVRIAYAESIASLAETALKFLEMAQLDYANASMETQVDDAPIQYQGSYDTELQALHELIQRKVVTLLSDPENIVKQTLLENGITRLCVFFGRQKANDVLLSHMITFLNDKRDWQLRGAFFDSIVGVAAYVGWQSLAMLRPLLEQGLSDTEEFVVCKALNALTCLAELGLLQKPTLHELVSEIVPFFCHPNMWIRYGAVGFVAAVARTLNIADVHCNLLPLLQPFLKQPIIQVDQEVILVSVLKEAINRSVYDYIVKSTHIAALFDSLQDRQLMRNVCRPGERPSYPEIEEPLVPVFKKLHSQGITEDDEDKLLFLRDIMIKLHRSKASSVMDQPGKHEDVLRGEIDLKLCGKSVRRRHADLVKQVPDNGGTMGKKGGSKNRKAPVEQVTNPEWHQMFGVVDTVTAVTTADRRGSQPDLASRPKSPLTKTYSVPAAVQETPDVTTRPRSPSGPVSPTRNESSSSLGKQDQPQNGTQARFAGCKIELRKLVHHKRDEFAADMKEKSLIGSVLSEGRKQTLQRWSPKGLLVAHLHEHKAAINRLQVSQDLMYFATASDDGTVKLWDLQKLDGKSLINKSRQTYSRQGCKMKALVFCQSSSSIACASDEGLLNIFRIEQSSQLPPTRLQVYQKKINRSEEGHVVDMAHFDTGSQSVLTYATSHGLICGWDLRSGAMAWKLANNPAHGLITSFVVDPCHCWLAVGTSTGNLVCWDLRFQLPITSLSHPRGARIRRLATHPTEQSWVVSAVEGNNEVSIWDLETGARRQTLWASNTPPLSQTKVSPHAVHALYSSPGDATPFILTAGSDRRIRMWDLSYPEHSQMVAGAATDNLNSVVLQYKSRLIDGTEVFQEVYCKPRQSVLHEDMPRRGPAQPPVGHHECINDIAFSKSPQNFILTAARDGVVKIWK